ncbi:putative adenylyl-sulfate kinase [mine drainage metagenome]|uniref:adenylyl-sulfate kinase n=1 Tax=mine drainage metagenome TaxID=410659 RepID=A0A1J5SEA2_9ZZZZ
MSSESPKPAPGEVVWHGGQVPPEDRSRLLGQSPITVWLTGLSASGKSTLAYALERRLVDAGHACYVLDGDNIRHGLNRDLGFSHEDRTENIRRIAEVARLMNDAGLIIVTAFISPYREDRRLAQQIIGPDRFFEIHVSTPLATCEARDPKGMYRRARAGAIKGFTGVDAPYEPPDSPAMTIDTSVDTLAACAQQVLSGLADSIAAFPCGTAELA